MDEDEVRDKAVAFLDGQHLQDEAFSATIRRYITEIPVSPVGLKYCPSCESASCGICGACHELDHEFLFLGPHCPLAVPSFGKTLCVAWSWAFIFLQKAKKVTEQVR